MRSLLHGRDDDHEHQEEEADGLAGEAVGIAHEAEVLVDDERGEDERTDADQPPIASLRARRKKVHDQYGDEREDERVDDLGQRKRRVRRRFVRNGHRGTCDECRGDDVVKSAPPGAAEGPEQQRCRDGNHVLECGAHVGEPARLSQEQAEGPRVEGQPRSVGDGEEAGVEKELRALRALSAPRSSIPPPTVQSTTAMTAGIMSRRTVAMTSEAVFCIERDDDTTRISGSVDQWISGLVDQWIGKPIYQSTNLLIY